MCCTLLRNTDGGPVREPLPKMDQANTVIASSNQIVASQINTLVQHMSNLNNQMALLLKALPPKKTGGGIKGRGK